MSEIFSQSKIGLFFGSFNPIHIGHLALANYFLEFADLNEVQLVLSPHNPLKDSAELASEEHRLRMLELALASYPDLPISICKLELELPKPSYTINTLTALRTQHPDTSFVVLMGADSIAGIERWKDYQRILTEFEVYVYPRTGFNAEELCKKYGVRYISAPIFDISASFIRQQISDGKNVNAFLPCGVWKYICQTELYKTI